MPSRWWCKVLGCPGVIVLRMASTLLGACFGHVQLHLPFAPSSYTTSKVDSLTGSYNNQAFAHARAAAVLLACVSLLTSDAHKQQLTPCRDNGAAVTHGMLRLAAARGDLTTLELLSSLPGFDPDAELDGFTALLAAVVHGQRGTHAQPFPSACNEAITYGLAMVDACTFASATACCWMSAAN